MSYCEALYVLLEMPTMARNPILDEIQAAREQLLAEYGGDVHAYVEEVRRRTLASGRPIAAPKRRARSAGKPAEPDDNADGPTLSAGEA